MAAAVAAAAAVVALGSAGMPAWGDTSSVGSTTVPPPPRVAASAEPAPPLARSYIVVDADTGAVLAERADHIPRRPASTIKTLTALIAETNLPADTTVLVGADAAGMEAAKINMHAGEVWPLADALRSLLIVSANDAAVAIGDRVGGSRAGFAADMAKACQLLGCRDNPTLQDPSGLDDSFSWNGGDLISAWDLAVVARAAMTVPDLASIVGTPQYEFTGPDGVHHVLRTHDLLLGWDPTAVGIKDGWTLAAGETLVSEASRGGHHVIVVQLDSTPPSLYPGAEYLLDQGFQNISNEVGDATLPPVHLPVLDPPAAPPALAVHTAVLRHPAPASGGVPWQAGLVGAAVVVGGLRYRAVRIRRRRGIGSRRR